MQITIWTAMKAGVVFGFGFALGMGVAQFGVGLAAVIFMSL